MDNVPVQEHVRRLMTDPGRELGRWAVFVRFQARLWRFCAGRLSENNLTAMSAALSFRTIFALIPALVLAFLAAGALGVLEDSKRSLRQFLDASGFSQIVALHEMDTAAAALASGSAGLETPAASAPATRDAAPEGKVINVTDEIEAVVARVEGQLTFNRIGPIGAALFIWTALSLLTTMEASLNRVFGAARSRSTARRVLLYWSVMTLGPVALAVTIFLGQRAITVSQHTPVLASIMGVLGWIGPMLVGVLVLAAVYILLPNTIVSRRAAFGGALVAVLLWLAAKWGFSIYVRQFVVKGNLYGILGVLPLFLLWLNLSWTIFLFGAELAHTAANLRRMRLAERDEARPPTPADALAAMLAVARPFQAGEGPVPFARLTAQLNLPGETVRQLVDRLVARHILCLVDGSQSDVQGERYVPARPSERLPVAEILEWSDSSNGSAAATVVNPELAALVAKIEARLRASVADLTVADVLADDENIPKNDSETPAALQQSPKR